jgi:ubiquinone biosynthesis protein
VHRRDRGYEEQAVTDTEPRLLGRAARIARVLAAHGLYGRSDGTIRERARRLREALEELGPTFAKLGQLLSTRPDLLPAEVVEELAQLQDDVTPLSEADVVAVMEQELGVPWEDVFRSIEPEPLAAGTIGQVHRARLEDGERVVLKVQRPSARDDITRDLGLLRLFAEKAADRPGLRDLVDLPPLVEHLSASLQRELDFRIEAASAERLADVLRPYGRLRVPRVHDRLSSARLLVLDEVVGGVPVREAEPQQARREAARQLLEAYFRQVLGAGFFHADPHPGNLLWADGCVWFLDLGMVGEVEPRVRELLLLLLLAVWREDAPFLAELLLLLAGEEAGADVDAAALEQDLQAFLTRFRRGGLADIELGPMLEELVRIGGRHGLRPPASLALVGKALAQIQLTAAELDPELDPFALAGRYVTRGILDRFRTGADPRRALYEAEKLRLRLTRLVEAFERATGARPGRRLQVEFRGTRPLEERIERASRRLALAGTAAGALVATGITAASEHVATWVPATLGGASAVLLAALGRDLLRR